MLVLMAASEERDALEEFLRGYRPAPMQLLLALPQLKDESSGEIENPIATAREVIEAGGVARLREMLDFDTLERNLLPLTSRSSLRNGRRPTA